MRPEAKVGAKGFEVEWCANVPQTEFGDCDLDRADYRRRDFTTHDEAERYARAIVGSDYFGAVQITEFVYEPLCRGSQQLTKEYIGESEFIDAAEPENKQAALTRVAEASRALGEFRAKEQGPK